MSAALYHSRKKMSVRSESKTPTNPEAPAAIIEAAQGENTLAEGNNFAVAQSDNPLNRNIVVSIRATLNGAPHPLVPLFR